MDLKCSLILIDFDQLLLFQQTESIEKIDIERNLQNRVYEIIKNYLIRPDVPPGTHLYEGRLAMEIGVSRRYDFEQDLVMDRIN